MWRSEKEVSPPRPTASPHDMATKSACVAVAVLSSSPASAGLTCGDSRVLALCHCRSHMELLAAHANVIGLIVLGII
jgi:hypothetical protein